jgi:hypothetical protein
MALADLAMKNGKVTLEEHAALVERIAAAYGNVVAFKLPEQAPLPQSSVAGLTSMDWVDQWREGMGRAANDNDAMRDAFARNFGDGIRAAVNGDLGDFLRFKLQNLASNMFDKALDHLGGAIFDIFKGTGTGSGEGFFGNILSGLGNIFMKGSPGFATGGSFKVGGSGGPDSKYIGMRLTPGEMVDIRKPGNDTRGAPMHLTINSDFGAKQFVIDTALGTAVEVTSGMIGSMAKADDRKKRLGTK